MRRRTLEQSRVIFEFEQVRGLPFRPDDECLLSGYRTTCHRIFMPTPRGLQICFTHFRFH